MVVHGEGKNEREKLHVNGIVLTTDETYIPKQCNLIYLMTYIITKMIFHDQTSFFFANCQLHVNLLPLRTVVSM